MDATHYPLFACIFLALYYWWLEMRTVEKLRDGHRERFIRMRKEHQNELEAAERRARATGWNEGREYEINRNKKLRDAHGRFAREESKA